MLGLLNRVNLLLVDYPVRPEPRYGYGKPPHAELAALLERHREAYARVLGQMSVMDSSLAAIADTADPASGEPQWRDRFTGGLDGIALYCFAALRKPTRFFEIGSGNATKFVARAVRDGNLGTQIVSVDPHPRAEVDRLCDRTLRARLEEIELSLFDELEAGDILYVDNSHRALQNSDVTVFFLEVLPRLAPGVLVGIDDICLPFDYPPEWRFRYYSEQYLLACYLLAGGNRVRPVLPCAYVSADPNLIGLLTQSTTLARIDPRGDAFWLEISVPTADPQPPDNP
jgi:hypothetical protein